MSSYGEEGSLERLRSKKLVRLLSAYEGIVDEIRVADLNQEMVMAH